MTKEGNKAILPDKPSDLIRLAVKDMKACKADNRYLLDMSVWHYPVGNQCVVCAAGSVMAQTLEIPINQDVSPYEDYIFHPSDANKLRALNHFRCGYIKEGLNKMNIPLPIGVPSEWYKIRNCHYNFEGFAEDLLEMADRLECSGL